MGALGAAVTSKRPYAAFISYRHVDPDRGWARWLHRALEAYRVPRALVPRVGRRRLGRVFRDEEELAASADLSAEIERALQDSDYLLVVCSPRAPESKWVNREIERFQEMGRSDRILALLIEGEPHTSFPPALRTLRPTAERTDLSERDVEPLAADVRPAEGETQRSRRRTALLRTAAAILGCAYDDLRRRAAMQARRRRLIAGGVLLAVAAALGGLSLYAFRQRDQKAQALEDVLRLSDAHALGDLVRDEEALWPLHPDTAPALDAWLRRADRLCARRGLHQSALRKLRGEEAGSTWSFTGQRDAWLNEVLGGLVEGLDAFCDPSDGLMAQVTRRRRAAKRLAEARNQPDPAWDRAIRAISASARYRHARLKRQVGLVPLGEDPVSGLQEFAHVGSGRIPTRDDDGRLQRTDDMAIVLVLLPPGQFVMGAQKKDPNAPNYDPRAMPAEKPVHRVTLTRPFFLGKFEVTQRQWQAMTGSKPAKFPPGNIFHPDGRLITSRHPVENVSWHQATRWLARYRLRLPTEVEWEYACRTDLPAADVLAWSRRSWETLVRYANVADVTFKGGTSSPTGYDATLDDGHYVHAPVGSYEAGSLGLHDMLGNVSELVLDAWKRPRAGDYPTDPQVDPGPAPPSRSLSRVARGGAFDNLPSDIRPTARDWPDAKEVRGSLGLRAAATPHLDDAATR